MDIFSPHGVIIALHAASATIAFFAGCLLIFMPARISNRKLFSAYEWALIAMVILLAAAIFVSWEEYSSIERIVFPGLFVLGVYMLFRAWQANRLLDSRSSSWEQAYIEHIGFTLISLFEGFIIVSGLNSGFPGWLVAVTAVTGLLAGRWLIGAARRKSI
jgi:membrane-associated HD superfamily phosphohydrolase